MSLAIDGTKLCVVCQWWRPAERYGADARMADGLRRKCLVCDEADAQKATARRAVAKEKAGNRMRPASAYCCVDCGVRAYAYHHEDYRPGRELAVEPVCMKCHRARHRPLTPQEAVRAGIPQGFHRGMGPQLRLQPYREQATALVLFAERAATEAA